MNIYYKKYNYYKSLYLLNQYGGNSKYYLYKLNKYKKKINYKGGASSRSQVIQEPIPISTVMTDLYVIPNTLYGLPMTKDFQTKEGRKKKYCVDKRYLSTFIRPKTSDLPLLLQNYMKGEDDDGGKLYFNKNFFKKYLLNISLSVGFNLDKNQTKLLEWIEKPTRVGLSQVNYLYYTIDFAHGQPSIIPKLFLDYYYSNITDNDQKKKFATWMIIVTKIFNPVYECINLLTDWVGNPYRHRKPFPDLTPTSETIAYYKNNRKRVYEDDVIDDLDQPTIHLIPINDSKQTDEEKHFLNVGLENLKNIYETHERSLTIGSTRARDETDGILDNIKSISVQDVDEVLFVITKQFLIKEIYKMKYLCKITPLEEEDPPPLEEEDPLGGEGYSRARILRLWQKFGTDTDSELETLYDWMMMGNISGGFWADNLYAYKNEVDKIVNQNQNQNSDDFRQTVLTFFYSIINYMEQQAKFVSLSGNNLGAIQALIHTLTSDRYKFVISLTERRVWLIGWFQKIIKVLLDSSYIIYALYKSKKVQREGRSINLCKYLEPIPEIYFKDTTNHHEWRHYQAIRPLLSKFWWYFNKCWEIVLPTLQKHNHLILKKSGNVEQKIDTLNYSLAEKWDAANSPTILVFDESPWQKVPIYINKSFRVQMRQHINFNKFIDALINDQNHDFSPTSTVKNSATSSGAEATAAAIAQLDNSEKGPRAQILFEEKGLFCNCGNTHYYIFFENTVKNIIKQLDCSDSICKHTNFQNTNRRDTINIKGNTKINIQTFEIKSGNENKYLRYSLIYIGSPFLNYDSDEINVKSFQHFIPGKANEEFNKLKEFITEMRTKYQKSKKYKLDILQYLHFYSNTSNEMRTKFPNWENTLKKEWFTKTWNSTFKKVIIPRFLLDDNKKKSFGDRKTTKVVLENIINEYKKENPRDSGDLNNLVEKIIDLALQSPYLEYPFDFNNIVLYIHGDKGHEMSLKAYTHVLWNSPIYTINFKNSVRTLSECINYANKHIAKDDDKNDIISFLLCMKTFGDLNTCLVAISDEILHFTEDSSCYTYAYLCLKDSEKYIITNMTEVDVGVTIKGSSFSFGQINKNVDLLEADQSSFFDDIADNILITKDKSTFYQASDKVDPREFTLIKEKFTSNIKLLSKSFIQASKSWTSKT